MGNCNKKSLNIPPHLKRVATLPCVFEVLMPENFYSRFYNTLYIAPAYDI